MAIDYTVTAIPTVYRGIRYRSRLEARWAAFFDLCDWTFSYEPVDLGRWSPDFALQGSDGTILVEVKPIWTPDDDITRKMNAAARESGFVGELLLLGMGPFNEPEPYMTYESPERLGWLQETDYDGGPGDMTPGKASMPTEPYFGVAPFAWYADAPTQIDFCHEYGSFHGRMTGHYDGGSWGSHRSPEVKTAAELWAEASNTVQWHRK